MATDTTDLLTELRDTTAQWPSVRRERLAKAADAIEILQAENTALRIELDRIMQAAANGGYCRRTHYPAGGTV